MRYRAAFVLLAVFFLAAPAHAQLKGLRIAVAASIAADGAVTRVALNRGAREMNPLTPEHPVGQIAYTGAAAFATDRGLAWLARKHRKLAIAASIGVIALESYLVVDGIHTARTQARRNRAVGMR